MTRQQARGLSTEVEAVAGRAAGRSQRAIASTLGVDQSAVSRALQRARRRLHREIPSELAAVFRREHGELELVRQSAWQHRIETGELAALDRVLKSGEQIADLWGLGRRARVDVNVRQHDPVEDLSNEELLAAAEAEIAEARARLGSPPERVCEAPAGNLLPIRRRLPE